jgi:amino-acid N-acetyltransferase
MVYDEDTVGVFFRETLDRFDGGGRLESFLAGLREAVAGRVWSARIVGRKPGGEASEAEVRIEPARADDAPVIGEILAEAGLPANAIREHIDDFLLAREGERVVGCVGLELFGETALLRSLAVRSGARGRGVGRRLVGGILEHARSRGAREAVLLTTTVQGMAARAGFVAVARETVPAALRDSWEFKADCCGTAVCMRRAL